MHWLDVTLLVVVVIGALLGARSGLLWQLARLVTFGLAIAACVYGHQLAYDLLNSFLTDTAPWLIHGLAYVATFLAVYLVCYGITLLLQRGLKESKLKNLDRVLGACLGAVKAVLASGAVLLGLALCSTPQTDALLAESKLAPPLLQGMRAAAVTVPQQYRDELGNSLERIKKAGLEKAGEVRDAAAREALDQQRRALEEQFHLTPSSTSKTPPAKP